MLGSCWSSAAVEKVKLFLWVLTWELRQVQRASALERLGVALSEQLVQLTLAPSILFEVFAAVLTTAFVAASRSIAAACRESVVAVEFAACPSKPSLELAEESSVAASSSTVDTVAAEWRPLECSVVELV